MGHIRLGELARTRKWKEVVALIENGAEAAQVATATIDATEKYLDHASNDRGFVESVFLLTQLPLAARQSDLPDALRACGVQVSDQPGLMELVAAVTDAIDGRMANNSGRTDLGEMAQAAAVETLTDVVSRKTHSFFGTTPEDVQHALAGLATVKQFSTFAKQFFGRLTCKSLDYFLSRAMPDHVGAGRRFATMAERSAFSEALDLHCREASVIVEKFSGEWFSKNNWEKGGLDRRDAAGFAHVALSKMAKELRKGAQVDGN